MTWFDATGARPGPPDDPAPSLAALAQRSGVVVCCGPGGVGKTTVAAALAVHGAVEGRRAVVVTIDPARRLANALGLDALPDTPHVIPGDWPGELSALMLDPKTTFDSLVLKYAPRPDQAEAILDNRFYRNIAGALSGTQEYMAMEKLYELHADGHYDLIVVDTPPTRNALDFIDAPRRITRFLDNRLFRLLMLPGRVGLRAVNIAAQAFLRTVSGVVGSQVVTDAVAFFQAFEGMEQGFRDRAQGVRDLMVDGRTAFVLVSSPRRDAVVEAEFFSDKLAQAHIPVQGLVVNRMQPRFVAGWSPEGDRERARALADTALGPLWANLADLHALADAEEAEIGGLVKRVEPAPVARVPLLQTDVHDLHGLAAVGRYVFAEDTEDDGAGSTGSADAGGAAGAADAAGAA
jgi:anion-transporting  ArsA/GET3 family ATPase